MFVNVVRDDRGERVVDYLGLDTAMHDAVQLQDSYLFTIHLSSAGAEVLDLIHIGEDFAATIERIEADGA